ncbi:MAG: hypothetical protein ACYTXC_03410 [Nostoc sp.]
MQIVYLVKEFWILDLRSHTVFEIGSFTPLDAARDVAVLHLYIILHSFF